MLKRILVLLILSILAVASLSAFLVLNKQIITGSLKIASGKIQIAAGEKKLALGKARLTRGEQELRSGKSFGEMSTTPALAAAAVFPAILAVTVAGNAAVNNKLAQGDKEVAEGRKKVRAGEQQLASGKLELERGVRHLNRAKWIRNACGVGAIFFAGLALVLCFYWRYGFFRKTRT